MKRGRETGPVVAPMGLATASQALAQNGCAMEEAIAPDCSVAQLGAALAAKMHSMGAGEALVGGDAPLVEASCWEDERAHALSLVAAMPGCATVLWPNV